MKCRSARWEIPSECNRGKVGSAKHIGRPSLDLRGCFGRRWGADSLVIAPWDVEHYVNRAANLSAPTNQPARAGITS
jgi:hypothetical protein